jgi:hypothetical protein
LASEAAPAAEVLGERNGATQKAAEARSTALETHNIVMPQSAIRRQFPPGSAGPCIPAWPPRDLCAGMRPLLERQKGITHQQTHVMRLSDACRPKGRGVMQILLEAAPLFPSFLQPAMISLLNLFLGTEVSRRADL